MKLTEGAIRVEVTCNFMLDDGSTVTNRTRHFDHLTAAIEHATDIDLCEVAKSIGVDDLTTYWYGEVEVKVIISGEDMEYKEIVKNMNRGI